MFDLTRLFDIPQRIYSKGGPIVATMAKYQACSSGRIAPFSGGWYQNDIPRNCAHEAP